MVVGVGVGGGVDGSVGVGDLGVVFACGLS